MDPSSLSPVLAYMLSLASPPSLPHLPQLDPLLWDWLMLPWSSLSRQLGRYHYYAAQDLLKVPLGRYQQDPVLCHIFCKSVRIDIKEQCREVALIHGVIRASIQ